MPRKVASYEATREDSSFLKAGKTIKISLQAKVVWSFELAVEGGKGITCRRL